MGELASYFPTLRSKVAYLRESVRYSHWDLDWTQTVADMIGLDRLPRGVERAAAENSSSEYPATASV